MKTAKILFRVLLTLELLFFVAAIPASMPHSPRLSALFHQAVEHPSDENRAAFQAAMERAQASDKRRQRIAVFLLVGNGTALFVLLWALKRTEETNSQPGTAKPDGPAAGTSP
jgi:hypothetical protein